MRKVLLLLLALPASLCLRAEVRFPAVIGDNMVIQRNSEAALWGWAEPGKKVTVQPSWTGQKYSVKSDSGSGRWMLRVQTPDAGGPYSITVSDGTPVTLHNVLSGDVWFCSGQSNMKMPMNGFGSQPVAGATEVIIGAKASRPIRICTVKQKASKTEEEDCECSWKENTPDVVAVTSAVAYLFADILQNATDIPVGIIVSAWGGSSIQAWMPREVLESEFPTEVKLSHLDSEDKVNKPHQKAAMLYNGQVAPLVPFTLKGIIWYQGENNRKEHELYTRLQTAYVSEMRSRFEVPQAPFHFVQIAPYGYNDDNAFLSGYFCEAQARTLQTIPHSGMAVTCDVGEHGTIHPCDKRTVALRLALLALEHDYGMDCIEADAPAFKDVEFRDGKAVVSFSNVARGISPMGVELEGFELAGEDRVFHKAVGRKPYKGLKQDEIEVSSPEVPNPVAVRYCFRNWCRGNVLNNYGIPLAPFRSDDWDDLER